MWWTLVLSKSSQPHWWWEEEENIHWGQNLCCQDNFVIFWGGNLLAGLYKLDWSLKELSLDGSGFSGFSPSSWAPSLFQTWGRVYRGSSYSTTSLQMFMAGGSSRAPPRQWKPKSRAGHAQPWIWRALGRQQGGQQLAGDIAGTLHSW